MKVGSRADYGLRAVVYLASLPDKDEPQQISAIAQRQQIPEDYLRQLLTQLRTAGIVRSVRGPHGGYMLARDPTQITMGEVVEVLEGPPERMRCNHLDCGDPRCALLGGCEIRARWGIAVQAMTEVLHRTTLGDLVHRAMLPADPHE
ncbi:MAG: Rrf2 family transcriptional regulator [Myxococcota bacterium]